MDSLNISAIPITLIEVVWDRCVPHISRVVERSHGELSLESVKGTLLSGNSMLITISDGSDIIAVNIVQVRTMDTGLKCLYIPITGGDRLDEWMPRFLEVAKAIGKDLECTELCGLAVRRGWMKKLAPQGWEFVHEVIRCSIGETEWEV